MSISFEPGKFRQPEAHTAAGGLLSDAVDAQNAARADAPATHPEMDRLIRTIWRLRQADGCPWDREQTHESIAGNMIEEGYEAVDAIRSADEAHICEELGDVLEQVLLHAQIAADAGQFNIDDVAHGINEKLVRRHPHVFGDLAESIAAGAAGAGTEAAAKAGRGAGGAGTGAGATSPSPAAPATSSPASNEQEALDRWDEVKQLEREARGEFDHGATPGLLDSIPESLPALMQAQKISKRAVKAGFEWDSTADVWAKFAEERAEFEAEEPGSDDAALEFGDLLFTLVNVARREGIDAEEALAAANRKFRARWAAMEQAARAQGRTIDELSVAEQNELWEQAKRREA